MFKTKIQTIEIDISTRKIFNKPATATLTDDQTQLHFTPKSLKDLFVSGTWTLEEGDAQSRLNQDDNIYGDFDDLETGQAHGPAQNSGSDGDSDEATAAPETVEEGLSKRQRRLQKKLELRKLFDQDHDEKGNKIDKTWFDEEKARMATQMEKNVKHFEDLTDEERVKIQGFRAGQYVRIEIGKFPAEFVAFFDPGRPILIGSLTPHEMNLNQSTSNFLNVRIKSHRWYKKILKNRDPLIVSLGFRRFETCPCYYIEDHNLRKRMLKYTPEHMHCNAIMRAPLARQGEGFVAYQYTTDHARINFRVAATGVVLESDKSTQVVKKLKLQGEPHKIYKNTAIIKGMFATSLEVSKFIGAKIQTVSGIRGHVRKVERHPDGYFRATFEDKVKMSDMVFCRTWVDVKVPEHYRLVDDMLMRPGGQWKGMKTVGQLRYERKIAVPVKKGSYYKPIEERPENPTFRKQIVPNSLKASLPFKNMPKDEEKKKLSAHEQLLRQLVLKQVNTSRKAQAMINASSMIMNQKKRKLKQDRETKKKRREKDAERLKVQKEFHEKQKKLGF